MSYCSGPQFSARSGTDVALLRASEADAQLMVLEPQVVGLAWRPIGDRQARPTFPRRR
jgi:hypothetical protein